MVSFGVFSHPYADVNEISDNQQIHYQHCNTQPRDVLNYLINFYGNIDRA